MSIILAFLPGRVGHRQRVLRNSQISQPGAGSSKHQRDSASNTVGKTTGPWGGPLILTQALWCPPTLTHTCTHVTHTETPDENQNKNQQNTNALLYVPQKEWKLAFSSGVCTPCLVVELLAKLWLDQWRTNRREKKHKSAIAGIIVINNQIGLILLMLTKGVRN